MTSMAFRSEGMMESLDPPMRVHRRARTPEMVEEFIPRSWIEAHRRAGNLHTSTDAELMSEAREFLGWHVPLEGCELLRVQTFITEG